jgi:hypothetical protein
MHTSYLKGNLKFKSNAKWVLYLENTVYFAAIIYRVWNLISTANGTPRGRFLQPQIPQERNTFLALKSWW